MRARGAGSGSGTRACVRIERRIEPCARDESRVSHDRAIRSKSPAKTADGPRDRRVFASFVSFDDALTLPSFPVCSEIPRVRNSLPKRAPCSSIERKKPGSSSKWTRRTFGETSNAKCTTDGRCVMW